MKNTVEAIKKNMWMLLFAFALIVATALTQKSMSITFSFPVEANSYLRLTNTNNCSFTGYELSYVNANGVQRTANIVDASVDDDLVQLTIELPARDANWKAWSINSIYSCADSSERLVVLAGGPILNNIPANPFVDINM